MEGGLVKSERNCGENTSMPCREHRALPGYGHWFASRADIYEPTRSYKGHWYPSYCLLEVNTIKIVKQKMNPGYEGLEKAEREAAAAAEAEARDAAEAAQTTTEAAQQEAEELARKETEEEAAAAADEL